MNDAYRFDWTNFTPQDTAVLCFVRDGRNILLIRKKRGLGAGKINGPGGKCDPGETPFNAAVRETQEEVGIVPADLVLRGVLRFAFVDGYTLKVYVFVATKYSGELCETAEAIPLWISIDDIPFEEMWEDDRYWLPQALAGVRIESEMLFHDDKMIEWDIRLSNGRRLTGP